jgi:predicted AlkP superfamily phosphohydrolase/phosphomutase
MALQANRLILVGLDGLNPEMIQKLVSEGKLPTMAGLMGRGAFCAALSAPPLDTPTNWTGIATGAWPGTHGITSFGIHMPGRDLGDPLLGGFNTNLCQAEPLWEAAERAGKVPFIFDYPGSWPPTAHRGVVARASTIESVWNPGYMWKGMGSLGPAAVDGRDLSSVDQEGATQYAWDRVYEMAELSIYPQEAQQEIGQALGPPPRRSTDGDPIQGFLAWTRQHAGYFADMAAYLQRTRGWDVLMCHLHAPDTLHHLLQNAIWPQHPDYDPQEAAAVWKVYAETLGTLDEAVGRIVEECGDERTIVALVSDHGATPCYKAFWINNALCQAGLLAYRDRPGADGSWIDWGRTQAINSFTATEHIWVNLKGRQPQGIVSPGAEYERVRERVLQALYDVRDPESGECPVSLAAAREDAVPLGHWGARCSDVVVFAKPEYYVPDFNHYRRVEGGVEAAERQLATLGGTVVEQFHRRPEGGWLWKWQAGGYHHGHLATAALGELTNHAFFLAAGPGIRQGYRREQAIHLVDVAPTLAYALGWPVPAQAEGAIRFDLLTGARH